MSQLTQEAAAEVTQIATGPLSMLGVYQVQFNFSQSSTSTRTAQAAIQNPPVGTLSTIIALQAFDVYYTDQKQYGYGKLQVALSNTATTATCTVTLRDDKTNDRRWEGTVTGMVTFYGK